MPVNNAHRQPKYIMSVAAQMVALHPQTLRHYENLGLIKPLRSEGNRRLYSEHDIDRLRLICRLTNELGVNLAGVEVILNMTEQIENLNREIEEKEEELNSEIERLRRLLENRQRASIMPFIPPSPPTISEGGSEWSSDQS